MTCPDCEKEVFGTACPCGWKPARTAPQHVSSHHDPSRGPVLSKEECGLDFLYALGRCASLRQIRKHIQLSKDRLYGRGQHPDRHRWQRELADDQKTEREGVQAVVTALTKLSSEDHAFVVDRYRDVMS